MMRKPGTLFCLQLGVILALCLNARQATAETCDYKANAPSNTRPLPDLFGDKNKAYSVQIQMNYVSEKMIIWGYEHYDTIQNKTSMTYTQNGTTVKYIQNYQDGYIAQIIWKNDIPTCSVSKLDANTPTDNFHLFGKYKVSGGGIRPYPIGEAFSMGEPNKFFYEDKTVYIDGVETDHWHGCFNWEEDNDIFRLDYYFGTIESGEKIFHYPVQAEVNGEKKVGNTPKPLHMIYEYFDFVPAESLEPALFDIPNQVYCEDFNKLVTRDIPALPDNEKLSFQIEEINSSSNTLTTKSYIYDPVNKIIITKQGASTLIDDFNTNIHYELNSNSFGYLCKTLSIGPGQYNSAVGAEVRMKTPDELLSIDDKQKYQYFGISYDRSIRAESWKLDDKLLTYMHKDSPLPLSVISPNMRINILDFEFNRTHTQGKGDPFDITPCRDQSQLKDIRITFLDVQSYYWQKGAIDVSESYKNHEIIQTTFAKALGISSTHIHWTAIFVNEQDYELYWDAVLVGPDSKELPTFPYKDISDIFNHLRTIVESQSLTVALSTGRYRYELPLVASRIDDLSNLYSSAVPKSGPLSKFTMYPKKRKVLSNPVRIKTPTADRCASLCLNGETNECRSLVYCSSTQECHQGPNFENPRFLEKSDDCDFYSRQFIADFYKYPGYFIRPQKAILYENVANEDGCAYMCLKEPKYFCKSFDYCADTGKCFIAQNHNMERVERDGSEKPVCQHYSRQSLADYTASINTVIVSIDKNHPLEKVDDETPDGCALKCSSTNGCGQFDHCSSTKECHFVSMAASQSARLITSKDCTTYTSKALGATQSASAITSNPSDNSTSYSGGSMAALGIIMSLIGVAMGCVGFFFLSRRQGWTVRK